MKDYREERDCEVCGALLVIRDKKKVCLLCGWSPETKSEKEDNAIGYVG